MGVHGGAEKKGTAKSEKLNLGGWRVTNEKPMARKGGEIKTRNEGET